MEDVLAQSLSEEDWQSAEATLMLTMIALHHPLTTQRIECRSAALRRLLLVKSSAWRHDDLEKASSDWVMHRQHNIEGWVRKVETVQDGLVFYIIKGGRRGSLGRQGGRAKKDPGSLFRMDVGLFVIQQGTAGG